MKLLSESRRGEIADLAEEVANVFFSNEKLLPLEILKSENITHSFGFYKDAFDGLLEHKKGFFHIYCNLNRVEYRTSPRARFTLGHELGHYFIDEHRNALRSGRVPVHGSFCEYESQLLVEKEADHFASHLLMPDERFRKVVLGQEIGLPAVFFACEAFGTSLTSTAIKYVRADFFVSAVLKWTSVGLGWKWLSNTMHQMGYRKTIDSLADVPRDSATARIMIDKSQSTGGFFDSCSSASNWFPYIEPDSSRDILLVEQAVSLGRFGVLTFLYPEEEGI